MIDFRQHTHKAFANDPTEVDPDEYAGSEGADGRVSPGGVLANNQSSISHQTRKMIFFLLIVNAFSFGLLQNVTTRMPNATMNHSVEKWGCKKPDKEHVTHKNGNRKEPKEKVKQRDPSKADKTIRVTDKEVNKTSETDRSWMNTWSRLPNTRFSHHVLQVLSHMDLDSDPSECGNAITLYVPYFNSIPNVTCRVEGEHCSLLKRIFEDRRLAYNVSIAFHMGDSLPPDHNHACFGSSGPGGNLCMPNFQDVMQMANSGHLRKLGKRHYRWQYDCPVPWNERQSLPIFRGAAWLPKPGQIDLCLDANATYEERIQGFHRRFKAVDFSVDHPKLLDARFSGILDGMRPCFAKNVTNGLSKLLPFDRIDEDDYFTNYQVALVLEGIGAAFRLSRHFMTRTAVVLQEVEVQEWYTPYLKPFVHYIPVSADLDDLRDAMKWVKSHPKRVKEIARNGRAFYNKYLSFFDTEEHIYEMVYRLSEYKHLNKKVVNR